MMQAILFTKLFRGLSLEEVAGSAQDLGFDGIDLLIRHGHLIEPAGASRISAAVRLFAEAGLSVPMVTTDLTDPALMPAERILESCVEAGVGLLRLGYWNYDPEQGYAAGFATARRQLDDLARLAEKIGIRLALQLHGGTIHGSGAQAAALLAGHDPRWIGAYPDPGNQVVQDGREDWRFTFDILRPWLCCIGVKNGGWFPAERVASGQQRWRSDWLGLADGMVPWDDILDHLVRSGYHGLLSFHSHYEAPLPQVLEQTRRDLQFVRGHVSAHSARSLQEPRSPAA